MAMKLFDGKKSMVLYKREKKKINNDFGKSRKKKLPGFIEF